jgi:membrane protein DedA with SNARE-associated domain/rhodanese-related sulfurtransferase
MTDVTTLLTNYGVIIVFLNVLLEQGGLPIPAIPTVMTAAALAGRFDARLVEIVAAGTAGALLADVSWFWGGRVHGRRVLALLCRISLSPDFCVRQTETVYGRVGPAALLFAKFVPGVSNLTVALAGVTRMRAALFVLLDGLGALAFVAVPVALGLIFKNALSDVLATLSRLGLWGLATIVLALALYLAMRWLQRRLFIRQLRMDRITVDELADLIGKGETPLLLDVRPGYQREREGMIPGAVGAHPSDLDPIVASFPRGTEVVVYCSCPNEASAATAARHLKRAGFKKIRPLLGGLEAWSNAGHPLDLSTMPDVEDGAARSLFATAGKEANR